MNGPRRLTLLAAVAAGLAAVLPAAPARAEDPPAALLEESAAASERLVYSGTTAVTAWRPTGTTSSLLTVRHDAGGLAVQATPTSAAGEGDAVVLARTALDGALLRVLETSYDLRMAGTGRCAGRDADVVEARRRGATTLAARFWIDRATQLLLRREVYDDAGRLVRSSAFLDVEIAPAPLAAASSAASAAVDATPAGEETGEPVGPADLDRLRGSGWPLPDRLPGGFVLFDARRPARAAGSTGQVVHLAFTDGLSTTSLFVQTGALGSSPPAGFVPRRMAGKQVWARDGAPERVVWSGGGHVLTLVSDAPDAGVAAAVGALPHGDLPSRGVRARLSRGLHRLLSWANPFG